MYAINFLMPYFFLYYYTVLRYGMPMIELMLRNEKNTPFKKFTHNFTNIWLAQIKELQINLVR